MTAFATALLDAKRLVRDHAKTAAVTVRLDSSGEARDWAAQLATEPIPDERYVVAGYVSVTGLVRASHEAFSRARRMWEGER